MGYYPIQEVRIERDYNRADRKLKVSYFDVVLNKWHEEEFEWTAFDAACSFAADRLKEVEM